MRRAILPVAILMLVLGCQTAGTGPATTQPIVTVDDIYLNANQVFTSVVSILNDLHGAGVFTERQWTSEILPGVNAANSALSAWGQHLHDSGEVQAESAFQAALPNLLQYVKAGKTQAATKPS